MMRKGTTIALVMLALLAGMSSWATVLLQMNTEALTGNADMILTGQVAGFAPKPVFENGMIFSDIMIFVTDFVKVSPDRQNVSYVTVRQLGGTYNGRTTVVPGSPTFQAGERVMVFLRQRQASKYYEVVGMAQGKFEIRTDPVSGRDIIVQDAQQQKADAYQAKTQRQGFNAKLLSRKTKSDSSTQAERNAPEIRFLDTFIREVKTYENPDSPDKMLIKK